MVGGCDQGVAYDQVRGLRTYALVISVGHQCR